MRVNLWIQVLDRGFQVLDRGFQGVSSFCFLYFNQIRRPSKYKTEKILIYYIFMLSIFLHGSTWERYLSRNMEKYNHLSKLLTLISNSYFVKQSFKEHCCESGIVILALRSFEIMLKVPYCPLLQSLKVLYCSPLQSLSSPETMQKHPKKISTRVGRKLDKCSEI